MHVTPKNRLDCFGDSSFKKCFTQLNVFGIRIWSSWGTNFGRAKICNCCFRKTFSKFWPRPSGKCDFFILSPTIHVVIFWSYLVNCSWCISSPTDGAVVLADHVLALPRNTILKRANSIWKENTMFNIINTEPSWLPSFQSLWNKMSNNGTTLKLISVSKSSVKMWTFYQLSSGAYAWSDNFKQNSLILLKFEKKK